MLTEVFDANLEPVAITPDGRYVATATFNPDCSTYIFDTAAGVRQTRHENLQGNKFNLVFERGQLGREVQPQSGQGGRSGRRTERNRERYPIAESDLERLDDGEAITVRPDGWLRGQLAQLEAVREDIDRVLEEESWQARLPGDPSTLSSVV